VPEAYFRHPANLELERQLFGTVSRSRALTETLHRTIHRDLRPVDRPGLLGQQVQDRGRQLLREGHQQRLLGGLADGIRAALGVRTGGERRTDHHHPPPAVGQQAREKGPHDVEGGPDVLFEHLRQFGCRGLQQRLSACPAADQVQQRVRPPEFPRHRRGGRLGLIGPRQVRASGQDPGFRQGQGACQGFQLLRAAAQQRQAGPLRSQFARQHRA
jgi:hypothetical protein